MKTSLTILSVCLIASACAQQQPAVKDAKQELATPLNEKLLEALKSIDVTEEDFKKSLAHKAQCVKKFKSLPQEKQDEWKKLAEQSVKWAQEKRIADSLRLAFEAQDIFQDEANLYNIIGSNYIELRDFKHATAAFKKAISFDPYNLGIQFNLAESYFVSGDYKNALPVLKLVHNISKFNASLGQISEIITFKIELCNLGLSKGENLTKEQRSAYNDVFQKAANKRTFRDHSLLTYYSKAAQAFDANDKIAAYRWIQKARFVFNKPKAHMPWLDTLLEFGHIDSVYKENTIKEAPTEPNSK